MQRIIAHENKLAGLFKLSERRCRDIFKDARVAPGKYNLIECIEIYTEKSSAQDEKAELARANRELIEIKRKILEKDYISVLEVQAAVADMILRFKNKMLLIPKELKVELENGSLEDWELIIQESIDEALKELREYDPELVDMHNEDLTEFEIEEDEDE